MGGEEPSEVARLLTVLTLLLVIVLDVPRSHSSVMLLTCVALVDAAMGLRLVSWHLFLPPGRRGCPGNLMAALPPIGLSNVASFLWLGAGNLHVTPLCWQRPCV